MNFPSYRNVFTPPFWETDSLYMDDEYWNKDEAWNFMSEKYTNEQCDSCFFLFEFIV
jgi:hypothetical protein